MKTKMNGGGGCIGKQTNNQITPFILNIPQTLVESFNLGNTSNSSSASAAASANAAASAAANARAVETLVQNIFKNVKAKANKEENENNPLLSLPDLVLSNIYQKLKKHKVLCKKQPEISALTTACTELYKKASEFETLPSTTKPQQFFEDSLRNKLNTFWIDVFTKLKVINDAFLSQNGQELVLIIYPIFNFIYEDHEYTLFYDFSYTLTGTNVSVGYSDSNDLGCENIPFNNFCPQRVAGKVVDFMMKHLSVDIGTVIPIENKNNPNPEILGGINTEHGMKMSFCLHFFDGEDNDVIDQAVYAASPATNNIIQNTGVGLDKVLQQAACKLTKIVEKLNITNAAKNESESRGYIMSARKDMILNSFIPKIKDTNNFHEQRLLYLLLTCSHIENISFENGKTYMPVVIVNTVPSPSTATAAASPTATASSSSSGGAPRKPLSKLVDKRMVCGRVRNIYKIDRKLYVKSKTGFISLKEYIKTKKNQ